MTRTFRFTLLAVALMAVIITGCIPTRIGVSWPAVAVIGPEQQIMVARNEFIVMIDPSTGGEVPLFNEDGAPRIDPQTNQARTWEINTLQGAQFFSIPTVLDDETLLIADYNNRRLLRIDAVNARVNNPTGSPINGQVIANLINDGTRVFLPYYNHDIAAYDMETGERLWEFKTDNGIWSQPLLHEGILYFGSMDHFLYAVNAETGEQVWALDLGGAIPSSPTLYNGRLYIGNFAERLFEISLTGEILNDYTVTNWIWSTPTIRDNQLYTADLEGFVYAFEIGAEGGLTEIWRAQAATRGIRPAPLLTEDWVIVAGRDGFLYWLDRATGQTQIQKQVQQEVLSDILLIEPSETVNIAQPLVVVSSTNHSQLLVAFTLDDGEQVWTYSR
ncbi:MAG: PQQ-binding-like beta-propeller repeat protein [Anaerolineae bacterium]|nr:PQQ-binding-like beta-propeller repeat protein [Anaerolineae bacterium]